MRLIDDSIYFLRFILFLTYSLGLCFLFVFYETIAKKKTVGYVLRLFSLCNETHFTC